MHARSMMDGTRESEATVGVSAAAESMPFGLLLGMTLTVFSGVLLLVGSVFLLMGGRIEGYQVVLAALLSAVFCWWGAGHYFPQARWRWFLIISACAVGGLVVFAVLSGLVYDTSWDGQNYQAEAILHLAKGWNPFYGSPASATFSTFLEFFSKGAWIDAAALYKLTGNFEQGKAFHLLLMLAAFLLCMGALSSMRTLKRGWVVVLSALMAFNPVSVGQMFTFYVDGLLASLLVITICLFILLDHQPDRMLMITLASALMIMVNIKLSGAIYAIFLGTSYGLWYFFHRKQQRLELVLWLIASLIMGGVVVGYNPYITQYLSHFLSSGNPFDPYDWKALIHVDYNSPSNFLSMRWGDKLLTSLFSQSQATSMPAQLKWPFTISVEEILAFAAPDVRVAGFGPLFGGALLVSGGLLMAAMGRYGRQLLKRPTLLFLLGVVAVSGLLNAEAWWARYVPQLWMVPILTVVLMLSALPRGKLWVVNLIVVAILCVNQLMIAGPAIINAVGQSILQRQQLAQIQNTGKTITVNFNYFVSTEFRFRAWGIDYQVVEALPCDESQQIAIVGSESRICWPEA